MSISRALTIACLFLLLAACGGSVTTSPPAAGYTLSYVVAGGLTGMSTEIDVDDGAKSISRVPPSGGAPQIGTLTDADRATLTAAVTDADIPNHPGPYLCGQCADQSVFEATLVAGGTTTKAQWESGSDAPQALFQLGQTLNAMAEAKFP